MTDEKALLAEIASCTCLDTRTNLNGSVRPLHMSDCRSFQQLREERDAHWQFICELATLLGHVDGEATWGTGKVYWAVNQLRAQVRELREALVGFVTAWAADAEPPHLEAHAALEKTKGGVQTMTPDEFHRRVISIEQRCGSDQERAHAEADDLIIELLKELGYKAGAEAFDEMEKWYA